jgi:1-acyl-sn-glycerol-3-phosphate acyltransferase
MRNTDAAPMPLRLSALLLRRLRLLLRAALHVLPWLLHLFIANTLLSFLLPLTLLSPTATYHTSSLIAASVWKHIQRIFTSTNKARIIVTGDALPPGESAIVVCNHVEWTDFYLIQELAIRAGMLGRCRWFAKKELKWVPFLGWGLWAMGMPLVSRKWMEDRKELDKVFKGVVERKWPICRFHLFTLHAPHSASIYLSHFLLHPTRGPFLITTPLKPFHPIPTLPLSLPILQTSQQPTNTSFQRANLLLRIHPPNTSQTPLGRRLRS